MHEGHRQRMYKKLVEGGNFYDHEILEMLLFNAFPRKNTNPVAHALIGRFGSLSAVFKADVEELKSVDGVGESTAVYLKCVGECISRIAERRQSATTIKNRGDVRAFVTRRLRGKTSEVLEMYFLSKSGAVKRVFTYTSENEHRVTVPVQQLAAGIAKGKPHAVIFAHNHLNGNSSPSQADDHFTKLIQLICDINGAELYDHCIYSSDENIYSYYDTGRIDEIRRNYSMAQLIKTQDEATRRIKDEELKFYELFKNDGE